jgi:hypothetical protein
LKINYEKLVVRGRLMMGILGIWGGGGPDLIEWIVTIDVRNCVIGCILKEIENNDCDRDVKVVDHDRNFKRIRNFDWNM